MEVKIAASPSNIYCKHILTHPVKIIYISLRGIEESISLNHGKSHKKF